MFIMKGIYCEKWINSIDLIINGCPELAKLSGKKIFITGATGLICSSVIDILIRFNQFTDRKIQIIAAGRDEDGIRKRFGEYVDKDFFVFYKYDSTKNNILNFNCDYVIHGASNAFPGSIYKQPVETMVSNINGIRELLDYARKSKLESYPIERVLYISSSEVYGNNNDSKPFIENKYGSVDILNLRNSYAEAKRAAETLCVSYVEEYGIDVVTVRPGHIYGPTASKKDNRVSSMWTYDAASGRDIIMKSDGSQLRSYTYCLDCASAIITVLLEGEIGNAYNISNPNSIVSIKEMAEMLARLSGVRLVSGTATNIEKKSYNTMRNSSLDSEKLEKLGWQGLFDLESGLRDTIDILKCKE